VLVDNFKLTCIYIHCILCPIFLQFSRIFMSISWQHIVWEKIPFVFIDISLQCYAWWWHRQVFGGFDPTIVAKMEEKEIMEIASNKEILLPDCRVRCIVDNAKCIMTVRTKSLIWCTSNFLWLGFLWLNHIYIYPTDCEGMWIIQLLYMGLCKSQTSD